MTDKTHSHADMTIESSAVATMNHAHKDSQAMQTGGMVSAHEGHVSQSGYGWEMGGLLMLFLTIGLVFWRKKKEAHVWDKMSRRRWDLLKAPWVKALVKSRYFSFTIRFLPAALLILVILSGIFGHRRAAFSAGFTWLFWWTILIFFIAFAGKVFCAICPWDFFANLFQFGPTYKKGGLNKSLNLKWPKSLANIYPATVLFILLTWLELGFDITRNSYVTAILGLGVLGFVVLSALLFERRSFCRYACPVGRISGLYSQVSPLEIRVKDPEICKSCRTKECVKGTDQSSPCPTQQVPFRLNQNTYCTLCTECVRSCQKDNLTLKARPVATDLKQVNTTKKDEVSLGIVMVLLTFFHGLTMTPTWFQWTDSLSGFTHWNYSGSFSLLMILILALGFAAFWLFEKGLEKSSGLKNISLGLFMVFIPLTLGYHLGHNVMHLLGEITYLVPMISDPLGYGWNLLGLHSYEPEPLFSHQTLKYLEYLCIAVGFYYSVKILRVRVEQVTSRKGERGLLYLSHYLFLFVLGGLALWFVNQPMVMRSGL